MANDCKREALYFTGIYKEVAILIPKKNGDGYLKSPFGGHHSNNKHKEFTDLKNNNIGDCCDINGYLSVGIRVQWWQDGYNETVTDILNEIVRLFPQCSGYKEIDSDTFYSHVSL